MFNRSEVFYVLSHLVITLALIVLYGVTVVQGKPDTTLQNGILLALGFWFGTTGGQKLKDVFVKSPQDTPVSQDDKVPTPPKKL